MAVKSILLTVLVAALATFLYGRSNVLNSFVANAPDRLKKINTLKNYEIKFADRMRNCEDAVLLKERQLAITACDPGRDNWNVVMGIKIPGELPQAELFAYNYATSGAGAGALTPFKIIGFPGVGDFRALGLEIDEPTSTLFVTSHAQAGPRIEVFHLDLDRFTATHAATLTHPLLNQPNSIQLLGGGGGGHELYVSNDHYFTARKTPVLAKIETLLGLPFASVVHVSLDPVDYAVQSARVVARLPFANGVALVNETTLAVASSSGGAVHLYRVGADRSLTLTTKITLPFLPDNVELKDGKTLLITGHPHLPSLAAIAQSRHVCNDAELLAAAASDEEKEACAKAIGLSWVAEWSEEQGLRNVFVESIYGSSTTTVWDGEAGFGLTTGLYEKGLFTWRV
ncbi:Six-bladed beta-propeller, TolB-like protein [Beauveria brongniartii RCEF 3172]|uniref:Six-bladed beta-propeller, TolB-like protein n=1 Tax=Beauveria brongniartii RCEF 3172 TaxID=1081107 RepID=A0A167HKV6_9HYPO|nr:Six-bladed beta-propeller, TolB-like protein [Beauveria brongniartii RCEF 3172]